MVQKFEIRCVGITEYLLLYLSHARTHARDACMYCTYVYARQRNATWEGGVVSAQ